MKNRSVLFLIILIFQVYAALAVVDRPKQRQLVNDLGNILSPAEEKKLERKLVAFDNSTSTQISIVTIVSLEGADIAGYAFELGEKWGIGRKGKDNGVLFLIAVKEHKMFIAPGYGLEGVVTDIAAKRIVENYLKPNFRAGNFYKGLDEGTDVVMGLATGEFTADKLKRKGKRGRQGYGGILILLAFFAFMIFSRYRQYKGSNISTRSSGFWTYMLLASAMGGGRGYGSFSSGSGSFGGGGFGGFGGGSFGGGGAGGSW